MFAAGCNAVSSSDPNADSAVMEGGAIKFMLGTAGLARLTQSVFRGNRAKTGGAVAFTGTGRAEIRQCVFDSNIAFASGGAVSFQVRHCLCLCVSAAFVAKTVPFLAVFRQPERTRTGTS